MYNIYLPTYYLMSDKWYQKKNLKNVEKKNFKVKKAENSN